MQKILNKLLSAGEGRTVKKLAGLAGQVNRLEDDFVALSDTELREETDRFRARLADGETLDDLLPEAFAAVREAAKRTLGQRHFDVQLMGGAGLHLGNIAEMKTGEGKTLVATLPAYLNALADKGVHIITVNDFLASYQSDLMGRVFRFLGMSTGCILSRMRPDERRQQYGCDITYGTNNEFGFDYLRDNMAWAATDLVQRGHNFAIVDEVDSILIDEARTPLIISGPASGEINKWYVEFSKIAKRLVRDEDYEVDEKKRTVGVLESGIEKVEDYIGVENLYESVNTPLVGFLNNAVRAKELFKGDKDYVVMDGEVLIVDEHTGRILPGRRYNEGMHQAIEAKEGVKIQNENQTLATITLQNYFRLYDKLGGMTGTAQTEASEFMQIYKLGVVQIPTNKPMIRMDQADLVYKTEVAKFDAVVEDIAQRNDAGQPVLVGTVSVAKSEYLSKLLGEKGIVHEVLNAKQHAQEASIVALAGRKAGVTVATNMAGRGTDIMLGGNAEFLAVEDLRDRGLDSHETPEEYEAAWPQALERANAAVASGHDEVTELGGLYVLGTERHESRRIDNQLRGRSGRQGDPGESRFYLSLTDDLMRLFNSGMAESLLTRAGIPDDVPLESKMVTRAIQSAQSQVEGRNFEIRKNVLKYDDVLNRQREVIYAERRRVLQGEDLHEQIRHFIDDVVAGYVSAETGQGFADDWDLDQLWQALRTLYPVSVTVDDVIRDADGRTALTAASLTETLSADAQKAYDERESALGETTMRELERRVVLQVLDRKWREHLYEMDYLQEGIGLRAMAQRDPLVEYQREGYQLYSAMTEAIKEESIGYLFNVEVEVTPAAGADGTDPAAVAADGSAVDGSAADGSGTTDGSPAKDGDGSPAKDGDGGLAEDADGGPAPQAQPQIVAKGLDAPERPTQLRYSAPTVDGEAEVEVRGEDGRVRQDQGQGQGGGKGSNRAERRAAKKAARRPGQ